MNQPDSLGGIVALASAAIWGTSDFLGGLACRDRDQYQVLWITSISGLVCLVIAMFIRGEGWPGLISVGWSAAAGICGGIGIAALYRGLARSEAALVAPTSAVIAVILPVVVGTILHGAMTPEKWVGIGLGMGGIWLVSSGSGLRQGTNGLGLAIFAGFNFGGFFTLLAQVQPGFVFSPLVIARTCALLFTLLMIFGLRRSRPVSPTASPLAILSGILDAGGNVFYLLAVHLTRLEVAAVLSSMYPVTTVALAALISKQRGSAAQKLGVGLCLLGIVLIAA
jgi:drug/metabolite transporter (DMT)-like permease